jgi:NADP-dependent 3-hydroxy acid dehydrogenase YdfG
MQPNTSEGTTPNSYPLSSRHVMVVGGSSGIGKATARAALDKGARVTLVSRGADKLRVAADALGEAERVTIQSLDMTDREADDEHLPHGPGAGR